ncbi:MAG: hypothetical protein IPQ28_14250 [Sphingobacteriales bacterium]|nr:hypothetical protein [Sphingobacteriales bacterium]
MQNLTVKVFCLLRFVCCLPSLFSAWAQTTAKGTVTDAATNEGLPV